MLARDQPEPRRHLPACLKIMAIPQRRHKGRGAQRPNAFHLLQPLTRFHLVAEARELACDGGKQLQGSLSRKSFVSMRGSMGHVPW
jgi:hypothetical protein